MISKRIGSREKYRKSIENEWKNEGENEEDKRL